MKIIAAIYVRVSTKEQADGKISPTDQLESCKRAIKEHSDWKLYKEYVDLGVSGHLTEERAGFQAMLRDAREHKFNLVMVKDFDRYARNRAAATVTREELKELGIQTYAINSPVEPRDPQTYDPDEDDVTVMVEGMSDIRSDLERKAISRRLKMGRTGKAKEGNIPNRAPFGYKIDRSINEHGKIVRSIYLDDEGASIIRSIFDQYLKGLGVQKIAKELNKQGKKSPMGGIWTAHSIKYMLCNITYTGKVSWGWRLSEYKRTKEKNQRGKVGIVVQGNHPPIISKEVFNKAQEIKKERGISVRGGTSRSLGLLTGLLKCVRCGKGGNYQTRHHKRSCSNENWHDTTTYEYLCSGYKYSGICSPRIMSATKLEGAVLDQIRSLYGNQKIQKQIIYKGNDETKQNLSDELLKLEQEHNRLPERLKRQQEAFERNIITVEEYGNAMTRLRDEGGRYELEVTRLKTNLLQLDQNIDVMKRFANTLKDFDNLWGKMMLDEKKQILRTVIKQIRAGDGKIEIDFVL